MPYGFPHEDLFVWGVVLLIAALLAVRVIVGRRRTKPDGRNLDTGGRMPR